MLRDRLGPGVRSLESFRESMGVPRPASVREMLTREIALRFVGFHCFGETDKLSASDEPYFTFGVLPAVIDRKDPAQAEIHENVDAGESVAEDTRAVHPGATSSSRVANSLPARPLELPEVI